MINKTAVVILAYRRSDLLARLLNLIPPDRRIYICIDGPNTKTSDSKEVEQTVRTASEYEVTHSSFVTIIKREKNLGGPIGIPSFIDHVFCLEERLIILEEDCLPAKQAFEYADYSLELLQAMPHIGGGSLTLFRRNSWHDSNNQARLSRLPIAWGWFISRNQWQKLSPTMPENREFTAAQMASDIPIILRYIFPCDPFIRSYWVGLYSSRRFMNKKNWDYVMMYHLWRLDQYFLAPPANMISNIGYDDRAQNTSKKSSLHERTQTKLTVKQLCSLIRVDNLSPDKYTYIAYDFFSLYGTVPGIKAIIKATIDRTIKALAKSITALS